MLRYRTNFGAKWAKLVQLVHKFVERSRFEIFRNERTRSTLLDPKLMFWGGSECYVTHELWCKMGRTGELNVQVRVKFFAMNAPNPPHWTPNSRFGALRTISLLHELGCKTG
jgi:hypothetical protein